MNKSHISHLIIFVLGMSIAGIVGLVIVSADTGDGTKENPATSKDTSAINLTHDHAVEPGEVHVQSNQAVYAVDEWDVLVSGVLIEGHQLVNESDLRFETTVEAQLRGLTDADERSFNACARPLLTLSRTAVSEATEDLSASPWWTVKQELEANAKKVGGYYYFFKPSNSDCDENYRLIEAITQPLFQEQSLIIKGLNGA